MQYNCLLWGIGRDFSNGINCLKYQELLGNIKIKAATSRCLELEKYCNIQYIPEQNINTDEFDYVIVMSLNRNTYKEILNDALKLGFKEKQIISLKAFLDINFDMEKYIKIVNNPPTIISRNCWGGFCYDKLGLEYKSPFVNFLVRLDSDYLKILKKLKHYVNCTLQNVGMLNKVNRTDFYPLCLLDDVHIDFIHYKTFEDCYAKWESRKTRINWDNLFIVDFTHDPKHAREFAKLPYKNKICFTTFEIDKSLEQKGLFYTKSFHTDYNYYKKNLSYFIALTAEGTHKTIDIFEFLSSGKIIRLAP